MKWLGIILIFIASVASAQDKPLVRLEGSPGANAAIKIFLLKGIKDTITYSFKAGYEYRDMPFKSVLEFPSDNASKNILQLKLKTGNELNTEIRLGYKYLYIDLEEGRWLLNYTNTPRDEKDKLPEPFK